MDLHFLNILVMVKWLNLEGEALSIFMDKRSTVSWSVSVYEGSTHSSPSQSYPFTPSVAFIAQSPWTPWHLKLHERLIFPDKGLLKISLGLGELGNHWRETDRRCTLTMGKGLSPSHLLRYLCRMCRIYPKTHSKGFAVISRRWGSTSCLIWIERWWHKPAYQPVSVIILKDLRQPMHYLDPLFLRFWS